MTATRETEIKLRVEDLGAVRRSLKILGFRVVKSRRFESNRLFDFADLRLRKSGRLLRLRFEDGRCLVTFKGAPLDSRIYKVRPEIETHAADGARMGEIFAGLGLSEKFRYDKYRTTYAGSRDRAQKQQPRIEVDETPIGNYLELEGPPRWIDLVARKLGYSRKDYMTASYAALYFEHCRRLAKRAENMTFRRGK
jgi:adenylate cyclase, class 2